MNAVFEKLFPGISLDVVGSIVAAIIGVAVLVGSTVAVSEGSSVPDPGVKAFVDVSRTDADQEVRLELTELIRESRAQGVDLDSPLSLELASRAQQLAEANAQQQGYVAKSQSADVLQASLAYDAATAKTYLSNFLSQTDSHCALASDFGSFGVGAASANGRTFVVVLIGDVRQVYPGCEDVSPKGSS